MYVSHKKYFEYWCEQWRGEDMNKSATEREYRSTSNLIYTVPDGETL